MKNTFGNAFAVTLFGESHGESIGAVIDCPPPGIRIDTDNIKDKLNKRKSDFELSTSRNEPDNFRIVSGVYNGFSTGTPLTIIIDNKDADSCIYEQNKAYYRPSHADYTADVKYHGFQDYRGGGHFSGRITAALVAVGAIAEQILLSENILIGTHISYLGGIKDREFVDYINDIHQLHFCPFPVLDKNKSEEIKNTIRKVKSEGDSIGGILESAVIGMPAGVGEPWFDSIEGMLSHILFSIPGIKGVEFGTGFDFAENTGSCLNDEFYSYNGKIYTSTNNNGGINGGITNSMPIVFRCAVKPTPSISKPQRTVNKDILENEIFTVNGRHDPCFVHRAAAVVDSVTAICLTDILMTKFGSDWFVE